MRLAKAFSGIARDFVRMCTKSAAEAVGARTGGAERRMPGPTGAGARGRVRTGRARPVASTGGSGPE
jgi:hypothetical protein